ncbi:hypothetical protein IQ249_18200 [Lusitaniella coriacea LEGE 07157]|uniref:Uncharacterized protein n=1 Tax=Lusitaniella coriacea LEGE 07157 TaxID=945747 RepID=A0A8J7JCR9_9CYAN|nr:hypothetical protein [Lusitaniella coriacea]MBE9117835.1 hypothetical protein [Lusitaniella coriacea LEGE 07157]
MKLGETDRALEIARSLPSEEDTIWILQEINEAFVEAEEEDRDIEAFDRTVAFAQSLENASYKARVLSLMAVALVEVGERDRALEIARSLPSDDAKAALLKEIALSLVERGMLSRDKALELTQWFDSDDYKICLLRDIARALAEKGEKEIAIQLLDRMLELIA